MADVTAYEPGQFCWTDLATTDPVGAKRFYSSLLGWTADDMPAGPGMVYTMLKLRGRDAAALSELRPELRQQGIPSHWQVYVAVSDVDAAATKAASLGASVVAPPFDVLDAGRMAVIVDPTGATVSLWQARKHSGAAVANEAGAMCWFELATNQVEKARAFYADLFGWTFEVSPDYSEIVKDGKHQGGIMKIDPNWGPVPPHWSVYFMTPKLDGAVDEAKKLGAKVLVPPMEIPNAGRFSVLEDPQGASFSLYEGKH